jgi:hypothetical protein
VDALLSAVDARLLSLAGAVERDAGQAQACSAAAVQQQQQQQQPLVGSKRRLDSDTGADAGMPPDAGAPRGGPAQQQQPPEVALPPGSLTPASAVVPVLQAPSLEQFLVEVMMAEGACWGVCALVCVCVCVCAHLCVCVCVYTRGSCLCTAPAHTQKSHPRPGCHHVCLACRRAAAGGGAWRDGGVACAEQVAGPALHLTGEARCVRAAGRGRIGVHAMQHESAAVPLTLWRAVRLCGAGHCAGPCIRWPAGARCLWRWARTTSPRAGARAS